jgi:hypothetical protein
VHGARPRREAQVRERASEHLACRARRAQNGQAAGVRTGPSCKRKWRGRVWRPIRSASGKKKLVSAASHIAMHDMAKRKKVLFAQLQIICLDTYLYYDSVYLGTYMYLENLA